MFQVLTSIVVESVLLQHNELRQNRVNDLVRIECTLDRMISLSRSPGIDSLTSQASLSVMPNDLSLGIGVN